MSHKKHRSESSAEPAAQAAADRPAGQDAAREALTEGTKTPKTPRLTKILLVLASLLLAAWTGFLVVLAILSSHPKA